MLMIFEMEGAYNKTCSSFQEGKAIFNMAASFHIKEEGENHQIQMPNVLTPDLLLTDIQQAEALQKKDPIRFQRLMKAHPQIFEFKPVNKAIYLQTQKFTTIGSYLV